MKVDSIRHLTGPGNTELDRGDTLIVSTESGLMMDIIIGNKHVEVPKTVVAISGAPSSMVDLNSGRPFNGLHTIRHDNKNWVGAIGDFEGTKVRIENKSIVADAICKVHVHVH